MKRLLLGAAASLSLAAPVRAAPVNIVNFTSNSTLTTTAATSGCTTGQVAMAMVTINANTPTALNDSAGGSYTVSPAVFAVNNGTYVQGLMGKRVVGSGSQITTSTTFTVTASGGTADMVVEVYCVSDGTGIPTSTDNSSSPATSGLATAPAPTASTSYQFAMVQGYGSQPSITASGWTTGAANFGPGGLAGMAVAWRQSGGTSPFTWTGPVNGFDGVGFSEVSTSGGGGSTPHTMTTLKSGS